jgi:transposase
LQKEIGQETNRIRSSLALFGVHVKKISEKLPLAALCTSDGKPLPENKLAELTRQVDRLRLVKSQLRELDRAQTERLKSERKSDSVRKAAMLMQLAGIGRIGACILASEFFWRTFANRREVGSAAGLTGVPYQSGTTGREQGISKAGNARIRALTVELAWLWLRYQPESALSQWFHRKWSTGTSRSRRVGIVALARRLLIDLWRYTEQGIVPDGAVMKRFMEKAA